MELDAAERFHKKGFKKSVSNGNCYNCGKPGHIARNCKGKEVARLTNTEEPVVVREELGSIHDNKEQLLRFNGKIKDRKSTRLNSSHDQISYAVFCLKKKKKKRRKQRKINSRKLGEKHTYNRDKSDVMTIRDSRFEQCRTAFESTTLLHSSLTASRR